MKKNNLNPSIRQKRRIPRILALILAVVMVITSVPDTALASEILVEEILVEDAAAPAQGISADVSAQPVYSVSPAQQDDGLIIEGAEVVGGTDAAVGQEAQQDDVEELWLDDVEEIGEPVSMDTEQPADQGASLPAEEGTAQSTGTDAADITDPEVGQLIEETVEPGEGEEIPEEGMEETPEAEEEDVVELMAADTPMAIASNEVYPTYHLKFIDEDQGGAPSADELKIEGVYTDEVAKGVSNIESALADTSTRREVTIADSPDLSDIVLNCNYKNQSTANYSWLYMKVSTENYNILRWNIKNGETDLPIEIESDQINGAYSKNTNIRLNTQSFKVRYDDTNNQFTFVIVSGTKGIGRQLPDGTEITCYVKKKTDDEKQSASTFKAIPAENIDTAEIPNSKLTLSFIDNDEFNTKKETVLDKDRAEDGSVQLTRYPSELSDSTYTVKIQQEGLEGKYKVSGWEIAPEGEEQTFTNIDNVKELLSDSSLAQYDYERSGESSDGEMLSIEIPGKDKLAGFTVRPILKKVQKSFSIRAYTDPETAGLKIVKYRKKFSEEEVTSDGITAVPENQQTDVSTLYEGEDADAAGVGWKVYLDKGWYEDAYENLRAELYQGEELVKAVPFGGEKVQAEDESAGFTADWKADGASDTFLSFQEEALEEQNYLVFTACGTAPRQYTQDGKKVSVKFTADKKDVTFSIQQDRQTGSKFSYTLKKTESGAATELASGKNTLPSETVLYTLLAKGGAQDGQPQVVLDPDATYELNVNLDSRDQAFAHKGWTINGKEIKETGYPEEVSVKEDVS